VPPKPLLASHHHLDALVLKPPTSDVRLITFLPPPLSRAALAVTHWLVMFQVFTVELLFPLLSSTFTAPRCLFLVSWFPRLIVIIVIHVSCSPHALPRGTGSSQVVCDTPDALRVGACGAVGCGGRTLDDRRRVCCEYHARGSTFSPAVLHSGKDRLYTSTSPRPPVPPPPPVLLRHLCLANSSNGQASAFPNQLKICGQVNPNFVEMVRS